MKLEKIDVVEELKNIALKHNGILDAENVVEEARPEDSPLHDKFEWDDSEAGHQWRLQQARNLIRVCVSYQKDLSGNEIPVRVFVSIKDERRDDSGGYRLMKEVLSDDDLRERMLQDARDEMQCFMKKYAQLEELSEVFKAMQQAI